MALPKFKLHIPQTVDEAINLAKQLNGKSTFIAGGTDILNNLSEGLEVKDNLISLSKISSLRRLTSLSIGSGVTIADLITEAHSLPPVLGETARLIAGPALRQAATVGGNLLLSNRCVYFNRTQLYRCSHGACMKAEGDACLTVPQDKRCYAPISGDLAPVFLVLDAQFVLASDTGERIVPAIEFYRADGISSNVLEPTEILTRVLLPKDALSVKAKYLKLRPRSAMDFPEAGVAVAVKDQRGKDAEVRVAIGALGPAPAMIIKQNNELSLSSPSKLADQIWQNLSPSVIAVRNTSLQPSYRREMAQLFIRKLLEELLP